MNTHLDQIAITELIDKGSAILAELDREDYDDSPIRMSRLGSCRRQNALRLAGMQGESISGTQARLFQAGTDQGVQMAQALMAGLLAPDGNLTQAVESVEAEKELGLHLPSGQEIKGHCDLLITWMDGSKSIIEFKTAHEFKLKMMDNEGPQDSYLIQTYAYIWASGADEGWLIHANRNNLSIQGKHIYRIPRGDRQTRELFLTAISDAEATYLKHQEGLIIGHQMVPAHHTMKQTVKLGATVKKKPEVAEPQPLPWQCNYCPFGPLAGKCYPEEQLVGTMDKGRMRWKVTTMSAEDFIKATSDTPIDEFSLDIAAKEA